MSWFPHFPSKPHHFSSPSHNPSSDPVHLRKGHSPSSSSQQVLLESNRLVSYSQALFGGWVQETPLDQWNEMGSDSQLRSPAAEVRQRWVCMSQPPFHPLFLPARPIPTTDSRIPSVACPMSQSLRPDTIFSQPCPLLISSSLSPSQPW